jgi:FixJ family two-component response regulator
LAQRSRSVDPGQHAEASRTGPLAERLHRRNIMRKLELRTVAELTRYALREGLVAP